MVVAPQFTLLTLFTLYIFIDDGAYFSFHKSKQPQPCSKKGVVGSDTEAHDQHGGAMSNKIFSCSVSVRTRCQRTDHVFINKIN